MQALHKAQEDVRDAQERSHEIIRLVARVKMHGEKNNFAEMIREAFGGTG